MKQFFRTYVLIVSVNILSCVLAVESLQDVTTIATLVSDDPPTNVTSQIRTGRQFAPQTTNMFNPYDESSPQQIVNRGGPPQQRMLSRSDRFPQPPPGGFYRPVVRRPSMPVHQQSYGPRPHIMPQVRRRIQTDIMGGGPSRNNPLQQQQGPIKNSRFPPPKNSPPAFLHSKGIALTGGNYQRNPAQAQSYHPNSIHQQQQSGGNFKASQLFNGKVIVRPTVHQYPIPMSSQQQEQQQQQQQPHFYQQQDQQPKQQQPIYHQSPQTHRPQQDRTRLPQFHYQQQQHPEQQHQQPQQHQKQHQQQPYQQQLQPQQHQKQHQKQSSIGSENTYSVYEETMEDRDPTRIISYGPKLAPTAQPVVKEAQQYLQFMNTNEYFLPKSMPNYRKMDRARDAVSSQQQQPQSSEYVRPVASSSSSTFYTQSVTHPKSTFYNKPIHVAPEEDTRTSSSSIVVGNYQAGSNLFVVNSDGKKNVHNIGPATPPSSSRMAQSKIYSPSFRDQTPGPERIEFTERDAVHASYTNSPINVNGQRKHGIESDNAGIGIRTRVTAMNTIAPYVNAKPIQENVREEDDGDVESDDDMQQEATSADIYGRIPQKPNHMGSTSEEPTIEQKDTEEYCERICSNIQDEDEEIVCGSDGFMYTSEGQMECYASCLHIDVTIQSKGTCT